MSETQHETTILSFFNRLVAQYWAYLPELFHSSTAQHLTPLNIIHFKVSRILNFHTTYNPDDPQSLALIIKCYSITAARQVIQQYHDQLVLL